MSLFKDLLQLWSQDDLLSQAWTDSYEMLDLTNDLFNQAVTMLREDTSDESVRALKRRDKEINDYQQDVRRKVITHYAVNKGGEDLPNGLVLVNMVVDIERLGDYTKNILDLAIYHPGNLIAEDISPKLAAIEQEIISRYELTVDAIKTQDNKKAEELQKNYSNLVNNASDKLVNGILSGKTKFDDETLSAAVALYARYLKRVGAHLKNISTVLINPFDMIGYKKDD